MPKQFYVVFNGRKTGIFDNWPETVVQVNGFSNAIYEGHDSWESARNAYLRFFNLGDLPTTIYLPTQFRPTSSHVNQDEAGHVNRYMAIELEQTQTELEDTGRDLDNTRMEVNNLREEVNNLREEVNKLREQTDRYRDLCNGFGNFNLDQPD